MRSVQVHSETEVFPLSFLSIWKITNAASITSFLVFNLCHNKAKYTELFSRTFRQIRSIVSRGKDCVC